jgi:hypothetical protein
MKATAPPEAVWMYNDSVRIAKTEIPVSIGARASATKLIATVTKFPKAKRVFGGTRVNVHLELVARCCPELRPYLIELLGKEER